MAPSRLQVHATSDLEAGRMSCKIHESRLYCSPDGTASYYALYMSQLTIHAMMMAYHHIACAYDHVHSGQDVMHACFSICAENLDDAQNSDQVTSTAAVH